MSLRQTGVSLSSSQLRDWRKPLKKWSMVGGMQMDARMYFWAWEKCGSSTFKTSIFSLAARMHLGSSSRLSRSWRIFPLPNLCAWAMEHEYPKKNLREEGVNTGASGSVLS